jgi:Cu(I)/Ag(I) efflux system membrane fusion protein
VESSPGVFEPRDVQVGQRTDDKIQILSGINIGDKIAVSGSYLIDSESQLKGGGASIPGMKMDEPQGAKPAATPEKKDKLKMDDMKM